MRPSIMATAAGLCAVLLSAGPAVATPPTSQWSTQRISTSSSGHQANSFSYEPAVSGNGRFVAFFSDASNLVPGDTNGFGDIFVRDRWAATTTRVSVASDGSEQAGGGAAMPEVSGDGRYIVYWSYGTNLVADDTNEDLDVFRHDRWTGQTVRASIAADGTQGNARSGYPGGPNISDDGRFVVFESEASNLVPNDGIGNALDVFVRDIWTRRTSLVSVASDGTAGDIDSYWPSISDDGRYIAFFSTADNLVPNDTNNTWDVFVHDRWTHETSRTSVSSKGTQSNGGSPLPSISDDGRAVAYESDATNLVKPDTFDNTDIYLSRANYRR